VLTIFSTPKPFRGHIGIIQRNAIESWRRIHPDVEIILFGDEEGAAEICAELGLVYVPEVLRTESGTKRLDFIFGRAQQIARHDRLCYVNCDIILTRDLRQALDRVFTWRPRSLMIGRRWDTDITEPLNFSASDWEARAVALARDTGIQRFYHNIDYFAFPRGLYTEIPPLVIGRIWWDHWLVWKAGASGAAVVDVSDVVCAVHQNHDYGYHPQGMAGVWSDQEAQRNKLLVGGSAHARTIEDATYRLTPAGINPNRFFWLAPAKRRLRGVRQSVRSFVRTRLWHPLLDASRPLRHAIGLKQAALPALPQHGKRRHWLDR
jgi:hypothetical protein